MNRSLKEALPLILLLTATFLQLCQAYPETGVTSNEKITEEFTTDVETLSKIEEENLDQTSEGDLKRQSRKVPCAFHKLKSGIHKAAAIPCGAAAGAAAAAVAGKSFSGGISGTSTGEAIVGGGSLGRSSFGGSIGGGISEVGGGTHFGQSIDIGLLEDKVIEIGTSLSGAIGGVQELLVHLPGLLGQMRAEVEAVNAPVQLRYDVIRTCDNYAQAEKGISGFISNIYNHFKLPSFKSGGQVQVRNNFEIGSCLDNIKANMMSFLAAIRSWFSCDKLFSSNGGISKFQSYVNSIPSGSQCLVLNDLGKTSDHYSIVPYVNSGGQYSGSFSAGTGSHMSTNVQAQLEGLQRVISSLERLPIEMRSLLGTLQGEVESHLQSASAARAAQAYIRTAPVPVAPVYQAPIYQSVMRADNVMSIPSVSGRTQFSINQRTNVPASIPTFYVAPAQPAPVPAPLVCSGQSLIDNVYTTVSASPVIKSTDSYLLSTSTRNMHSDRASLDLLNVKVNLSRNTIYNLLMGQMPAAGDIIVLNLTDDVMLIGSASDDFSPITFNFIYRGISSRSRHNNNVLVWNLSENDFECNQNIFNDVISHLVYG